mgnify:FL=1
MTDRKTRREQLNEERERRDRLAYVGTLAAALVHEMRTPLNAVRMNVQMLEEDVGALEGTLREKLSRRVGRVSAETERLVKTLEEFLTFARPPRLDPVPSDINHILREVIEFSEPEFRAAAVRIEAALADDMFPVVLDHAQFLHVMLNLFRNAREAIDEAHEADGVVSVSTREYDNRIEIIVTDNGTGIPAGMEEKIFEVFFTTKKKGTGLGLGIVRRIVEDHGGTICAEGRTDARGARFRIMLPRGKFLEFKD